MSAAALLPVIEETADWIVVDKPPFLQAHPSKPGGPATLWDKLRELLAYEMANGGQVSIITRLDRETSGLTLVAKNRETARFFSMAMEARKFHKEYLALVWGWPARDAFTVEGPLLRKGRVAESPIYLKQMVHPEGAAAVTHFEVVERWRENRADGTDGTNRDNGTHFCWVRARPETGRMHQIRVHLAHAGHPIVGDKLYGPSEGCYLEFIETGWTENLARQLLHPRQALHARVLALDEAGLRWEAPWPADLADWRKAGRATE